MGRLLAVSAAAYLALAPVTALAAGTAWEPWKPIAGVVDIDGPRTEGSMIVAGSGALYLVSPDGTVTPFARGPGGYHEDPGQETYLANSPGGHVAAAECDFAPDETYVLRLHAPIGINRINAAGDESGSFANLTGIRTLTGIAFDTVGAFDHRLLVMGVLGAKATIFAVDCNGGVQVITNALPSMEGGMAVAPNGFGSFGGDLIVPDENTGAIYAIAPDHSVKVVLKPPLPAGVSLTLGGLGFVPAGLTSRGGAAYHADHKDLRSSFPGTDTLLRITSDQMTSAGIQDGDLLVAPESGSALIDVHCEAACKATRVIAATKAHGEGHIAFSMNALPPSPEPGPTSSPAGQGLPPGAVDLIGQWGVPAVAVAILLALVAVLGLQAMRRRKR
jgi:hypothetical protein